MKTGSKVIIIGCIVLIMGLPLFLLYGELSPNIFAILVGILLIIIGVYMNKGYCNKNCFMAIFSVCIMGVNVTLYFII